MKPFLEKLNVGEFYSFYVKTHETPLFEVGWHQHPELELIYIKKGYGNAFVGEYVGEFKAGDIFFIGPDVPHTFQKAEENLSVIALVVQFREDFWGNRFLHLPECKALKLLFENSLHGLKLKNPPRKTLAKKLSELEALAGLPRIIRLIECLQLIEDGKNYESLSAHETKELNGHTKRRINTIYQYTIDHFYEPITLEAIAGIAAMSIPAFCNYFKKCTKKTYIEFLTEVRIDNACKLLIDTEMSIGEICYKSGFNTLANFNKQFHRVKNMTPSHYRKLFQNNLVLI